MKRAGRTTKIVLAVVGTLVVAAVAIRGFMVWNNTRDVLPTFSPIPDGPRAPSLKSIPIGGLEVGRSTLAEVQQRTAQLGFECRDTSMRGLMEQGRQEVQAKMREAEERGDDPDTVSGASRAYYHSKKERNPQVQWACDEVDLAALDPVYAAPGPVAAGEHHAVVFIFDSAEHPLRSVMTSRKFQSQKATLAARDRSLERFTAALGPVHTTLGSPVVDDPTKKIFPRRQIFRHDWQWADRAALVSVMNLGPKKGIDLREVVEVPWPIVVSP